MDDKEELAQIRYQFAAILAISIYLADFTSARKSATLGLASPARNWFSRNANAARIRDKYLVISRIIQLNLLNMLTQISCTNSSKVTNAKKSATNSRSARNIDARIFAVPPESKVQMLEASIYVFFHVTNSFPVGNMSAMTFVTWDLANHAKSIPENLYSVHVELQK